MIKANICTSKQIVVNDICVIDILGIIDIKKVDKQLTHAMHVKYR